MVDVHGVRMTTIKEKAIIAQLGGANDGPSSSGPFTETKRRIGMFMSDEQEILNDIEPIMQSVRRILNPNEYNDGDPSSPDDKTFILNNIFSHHPDKAQKMDAGVDYIMMYRSGSINYDGYHQHRLLIF